MHLHLRLLKQTKPNKQVRTKLAWNVSWKQKNITSTITKVKNKKRKYNIREINT